MSENVSKKSSEAVSKALSKKLAQLKIECALHIKASSNSDSRWGSLDPLLAHLLRGVAETGSLRQTAMSLGVSYTKVWKVKHETEESIGFKLSVREKSKSKLTPEGKMLLEIYDEISAECQDLAARRFEELRTQVHGEA